MSVNSASFDVTSNDDTASDFYQIEDNSVALPTDEETIELLKSITERVWNNDPEIMTQYSAFVAEDVYQMSLIVCLFLEIVSMTDESDLRKNLWKLWLLNQAPKSRKQHNNSKNPTICKKMTHQSAQIKNNIFYKLICA